MVAQTLNVTVQLCLPPSHLGTDPPMSLQAKICDEPELSCCPAHTHLTPASPDAFCSAPWSSTGVLCFSPFQWDCYGLFWQCLHLCAVRAGSGQAQTQPSGSEVLFFFFFALFFFLQSQHKPRPAGNKRVATHSLLAP